MRQTQVEFHQIDPHKVAFSLKNTTIEYANALRRAMLSEVPTIAIDIVTVQENTSCMPDEAIVHRLGLLPIDSRRAMSMRDRQECPCEDSCQFCSARFDLDVKCDSSGNSVPIQVTSEDVRPHIFGGSHEAIQLVAPIDPVTDQPSRVSILKLAPGQNIKMSMVAYRGVGKVHAKWNPTATVSMRYVPSITLSSAVQNLDAANKKALRDVCHRDVFAIEGSTTTMFHHEVENEHLVVDKEGECDFCGNCSNFMQDIGLGGAINVGYVKGHFEFEVESSGVLPALDIVRHAARILNKKMNVLRDHAAQLPGNSRNRYESYVGGATAAGGADNGEFTLDLS